MPWERISYEKIGNIAKIMLNRPEQRNAQDQLMFEEQGEVFREADLDPEVKVIVFGAVGPHVGTGHDLGHHTAKPLKGRDLDWAKQGHETRFAIDAFRTANDLAILFCSKPVISMAQGQCWGGSFTLVMLADLVVASEDVSFANPTLRLGTVGTEVLIEPWVMGARKAKEFLLTGDSINAEEALRLGMINKIVPRDRLEEETMAMARKIAVGGALQLRILKKNINMMLELQGLRAHQDHHYALRTAYMASDERLEFDRARRAAAKQDIKALYDFVHGRYGGHPALYDEHGKTIEE